ncbi:MAG: isoaspartyl peptidase [Oscillospiraceae bacterium]|nr:isoaspartyl peptidase [Oscillospiraceae bacterium]
MTHKIYVARRRAKFKGCNGQRVNIPYGSILEAQDGFLLWKGQPLCVDTSQNAHDFFSQNDDDLGVERGALVTAILSRLETPPNASPENRDMIQARWDKVWPDTLCQKYKRVEHEDFWLWNHDFYNAPLEDLQRIAALIGAKA